DGWDRFDHAEDQAHGAVEAARGFCRQWWGGLRANADHRNPGRSKARIRGAASGGNSVLHALCGWRDGDELTSRNQQGVDRLSCLASRVGCDEVEGIYAVVTALRRLRRAGQPGART